MLIGASDQLLSYPTPRPMYDSSIHDSSMHVASGTARQFDVIVFATGYRQRFPFLFPRPVGGQDADATDGCVTGFVLEAQALYFMGVIWIWGDLGWSCTQQQHRNNHAGDR